jgi:hypothetical protein
MTGHPPPSTPARYAKRLASDPTVRFFVLGALIFIGHRVVAGDPRVIEVTPGVKADIERRVRDHQKDRPPTPDELKAALDAWKREEALYREALHEGLDRDDPAIRTLLADKVRARAALAVRKREPSDAELEAWLRQNSARYETPRRYDYQTVSFARTETNAERLRDEYEQQIRDGRDPTTLDRPIVGGKLTIDVLRERLGTALADRIAGLPLGRWERVEDGERLLLARLKRVEGGSAGSVAELRPRLSADLLNAEREQAVERAVREVVARYRFEEP